jgi:hypothetical protein
VAASGLFGAAWGPSPAPIALEWIAHRAELANLAGARNRSSITIKDRSAELTVLI